MSRLVFGNLNCELSYGEVPSSLPEPVVKKISAAATLLRVFNPEVLWIPSRIDTCRMVDCSGLPLPRLTSPMDTDQTHLFTSSDEAIVWGQTDQVQTKGLTLGRHPGIIENVWAASSGSFEACRLANDKTYVHELQKSLGIALEGARVVTKMQDFEQFEFSESWILKARYGVAGRAKILGRGQPDARVQRRVQKLLQNHGALVYEPWVDRTVDFGACGFIDAEGSYGVSIHELEVDSTGGFKGIVVGHQSNIEKETRQAIQEAFGHVASALGNIGYQGPIGIDLFCYRSGNGESRLHPINEINARMTYGHVARAYQDHFGFPLALRFGREPPENAILLLEADDEDSTRAWVERY